MDSDLYKAIASADNISLAIHPDPALDKNLENPFIMQSSTTDGF
jgi:hypothetical protein